MKKSVILQARKPRIFHGAGGGIALAASLGLMGVTLAVPSFIPAATFDGCDVRKCLSYNEWAWRTGQTERAAYVDYVLAATVILTTTGANNWTCPADFNSSSNTIQAIGPGSVGTGAGGTGGGGGAYSATSNMVLTPGAAIPYDIGAGNSGASTSFNAAMNAQAATANTATAGTAAASVGTTKYNGGTGGTSVATGAGGAGGGAGPAGAGVAGSNTISADGAAGGASGGGAAGGTGGVNAGTQAGGNGANGTDLASLSAGSGGGGGGASRNGGTGGNGGLYGGGAGCLGSLGVGSSGTAGQGIIVVTYVAGGSFFSFLPGGFF